MSGGTAADPIDLDSGAGANGVTRRPGSEPEEVLLGRTRVAPIGGLGQSGAHRPFPAVIEEAQHLLSELASSALATASQLEEREVAIVATQAQVERALKLGRR